MRIAVQSKIKVSNKEKEMLGRIDFILKILPLVLIMFMHRTEGEEGNFFDFMYKT